MKIEDKKLYCNSDIIGKIVLSFIFSVVTLTLYLFYDAKASILCFSLSLFIVFIFLSLEMVINIRHRIFSSSKFYKNFKSKNIIIPFIFLFYLFGTYYLYDFETSRKESSSIVNLLFIVCVLIFGLRFFNLTKIFRIYNREPSFKWLAKDQLDKENPDYNSTTTFHWISDNKLNTKFTNNAIYIVNYKHEAEILYAYENNFTVNVQRCDEYVDYEKKPKYIRYKDQKLNPSQVERYMVEYDKTFSDMTDEDIVLMHMLNI